MGYKRTIPWAASSERIAHSKLRLDARDCLLDLVLRLCRTSIRRIAALEQAFNLETHVV
jgi:hypothetical protein